MVGAIHVHHPCRWQRANVPVEQVAATERVPGALEEENRYIEIAQVLDSESLRLASRV